jgi:hypothetical protein
MTTDHERREGQWPVPPVNDPRSADMLQLSESSRAYADGYMAGSDNTAQYISETERRSTPILTFIAGVIVGIVVGLLIIVFTPAVLAAPLSGQPSVEDAGRSTAPLLSMDGGPAKSPATDGETVAGGYQESDGGGVSSDDILQGVASYYYDGPGLYASVPTWTFGDEPYLVSVCRPENGVCVTDPSRPDDLAVVTVRGFCACPNGRIIDLSRDAFAQLATLARGLIEVTVTSGTTVVLPATDTR